MDGAVPLVSRQQVEHEDFGLRKIILALGNLQHYALGNHVGKTRVKYTGGDDVLFVDGHHYLAGRNVVHLAAAAHRNPHARIAEQLHHIGDGHLLLAGVNNRHIFVGAVEVLLRTHAQGQRGALVAGPFHLVDVPVGAQQGGVADTHVGAHILDFLRIPHREGIVVAVSYEYAVRAYGVQIIAGHFDRGAAAGAVVVVPVLGRHKSGHAQARTRKQGCRSHGVALLEGTLEPAVKSRHSHTYPHAEEIERSRVGIIPLPHLVRRLVEVDHDGYTRHEEHQEGKPASSLVAVELEEETKKAKEEREEEIVVLSLVVGKRGGSVALVAQAELVDESYAALPVAVEDIAGRRGMYLVLPPHEVPHKVAPVHPSQLIVEEEVQVGDHGRLAVGGAGNLLALAAGIGTVELLVLAVRRTAPHAGEQHLSGSTVLGVHGALDLLILTVQRSPVGR